MSLLFALCIFVAWLMPIIIAFSRGNSNRWAVLVVDLFLGWTGIGWVVALAMSVSGATVAA